MEHLFCLPQRNPFPVQEHHGKLETKKKKKKRERNKLHWWVGKIQRRNRCIGTTIPMYNSAEV